MIHLDHVLLARKEGKAAFQEGSPIEENPYEEGTDEHTQWSAAWNQAKAKAEADENFSTTTGHPTTIVDSIQSSPDIVADGR